MPPRRSPIVPSAGFSGGTYRPVRRKRYRPTRKHIATARAQQRYFRSQGRAIERVAQTQKTYRRAAERGIGRPSLTATPRRQIRQRERREARTRKRRHERIARIREREFASQARAIRRAAESRRAVQLARISERGFRSQGQMVRRVASTQQALGVGKQSRSPSELARILRPQVSAKQRQKLAASIAGEGFSKAKEALRTSEKTRKAANLAPALSVLEQVTRPTYAIAGGARAAVRGENVAKAAGRGFTLKDKYLFSDVLKEAGVKNKTLRGVAGFGLDVALDPTTYVSFGTASVARKGLERAAREAGEEAARASAQAAKGAYRTDLKRLDAAERSGAVSGERATARRAQLKRRYQRQTSRRTLRAKRSEVERRVRQRAVDEGERGLTVRVAGGRTARRAGRAVRQRVAPRRTRGRPARERFERRVLERRAGLAPLTRSTAALQRSRRAGRAALPGAEKRAGARAQTREAFSEVFADVRPATLDRAEQAGVKAVRRESRATEQRLMNRIAARVQRVRKLSDEESDLIHDAIEAGRIGPLRYEQAVERLKARHPGADDATIADMAKPFRKDRLFLAARELRSEYRHFERVARRSGVLAGRVGPRSRTREQVERFAAQAGRSTGAKPRVRAQLASAEQAFTAARQRLRTASAADRPAAREALQEAGRDLSRVRAELREIEGIEAARRGTREIQRRRFTGPQAEAKGYVARIREKPDEGEFLETYAARGPSKPVPVKRRQQRRPRAAYRAGGPEQRAYIEQYEKRAAPTLAGYGRAMASREGGAQLNRSIVERFGRDLTPATLDQALKTPGMSIYRLSRGDLQRIDLSKLKPDEFKAEYARLRARAKGRAGPVADRYVVMRDPVVKHAQEPTRLGTPPKLVRWYDQAIGKWKTLALMTPRFLVVNMLGDLFNAYGHERGMRVLRETFRGRRPLRAMGYREKQMAGQTSRVMRAGRWLMRRVPPDQRFIRLTPEQADQIAKTTSDRTYKLLRRENPDLSKAELQELTAQQLQSGRFSALQVALLAERMGVIRQGRVLELIEERGALRAPMTTTKWQNLSRRVEDTVRIGTFLGGLHRGLDPREAASRASGIHFDYGDLTRTERGALRRLMPFYTFTSRNIPLQARTLLTSPGKYANVNKAREETRRAAGLPEGYEGALNEYEARQLGFPIKVGGNTMLMSFQSPFIDLNDVAGAVGGAATGQPLQAPSLGIKRFLELLSPLVKSPIEIQQNYSTFMRSEIAPKENKREPAPQWAVAAFGQVPQLRKLFGMREDWYDPESKKKAWGWDRRATAFWRTMLPGGLSAAVEWGGLGAPGATAQGRSERIRQIGFLGPRLTPYTGAMAQTNRLWSRWHKLDAAMSEMRDLVHPRNGKPIGAENPTPKYDRLRVEKNAIQREIEALKSGETGEAAPTGLPVARPVAGGARLPLPVVRPAARRRLPLPTP